MKVYRIYRRCVKKLHPVQDVTWNAYEEVSNAIFYQWEEALKGGGQFGYLTEVKKIIHAINGEDDFDTAYEEFAEIVNKAYAKEGCIDCGEYALHRLSDEEDPWAYRTN